MANIKVLAIDDDPASIRLTESLLTSNGYDVICARDGLDGFKKAQEEQPDVILLDLILPGMYGFELCKKMKEDDLTENIPVVIVTGSGLEEVAKEAPEVSAEAYVTKPYGFEELDEAIQKVIGKS